MSRRAVNGWTWESDIKYTIGLGMSSEETAVRHGFNTWGLGAKTIIPCPNSCPEIRTVSLYWSCELAY
jgi:hypothetical protein